MSVRVLHRLIFTLGLLGLTTSACEVLVKEPPHPPPPPQVSVETTPLVSIERACIQPLAKADEDVDALISVDLAETDSPPFAMLAKSDDDRYMWLLDNGKEGDAVAGDLRYSLAVAGPKDLRGQSEGCADVSDLGVELEPVFAEPEPDTEQKFRYCAFRPEWEGDCLECGGQWMPFYRCYGWPWYSCYFAGYRCYGW